MYLTIDQKSNTWLAWCYDYHDTDENIKEFVFYYHNLPVFIQAILILNENRVLWKITRIDKNEKILNEEQLKNAMSEAFQTYNISGWQNEESEQVEVIFNI